MNETEIGEKFYFSKGSRTTCGLFSLQYDTWNDDIRGDDRDV